MSLALDNKFIYPAHMMRSLKVHPLSDQFSKVMNRSVRTTKISWPVFIIFFFFYILNSIFKCTFLFPLQITCWHCSIFFFLRQVVLKFQILFSFAILCLPIRINKCHFKYSPVCNDHLTEYYLLDKYHRNRWIKYTGPV